MVQSTKTGTKESTLDGGYVEKSGNAGEMAIAIFCGGLVGVLLYSAFSGASDKKKIEKLRNKKAKFRFLQGTGNPPCPSIQHMIPAAPATGNKARGSLAVPIGRVIKFTGKFWEAGTWRSTEYELTFSAGPQGAYLVSGTTRDPGSTMKYFVSDLSGHFNPRNGRIVWTECDRTQGCMGGSSRRVDTFLVAETDAGGEVVGLRGLYVAGTRRYGVLRLGTKVDSVVKVDVLSDSCPKIVGTGCAGIDAAHKSGTSDNKAPGGTSDNKAPGGTSDNKAPGGTSDNKAPGGTRDNKIELIDMAKTVLHLSDNKAPGGTSDNKAPGPSALLLVGFARHEVQAVQQAMATMGATMVKIIPCPNSALTGKLRSILEADTVPDYEAPDEGVRRACIISGLYDAEEPEVLKALEDAGLPPTKCCAVPAASYNTVTVLEHVGAMYRA